MNEPYWRVGSYYYVRSHKTVIDIAIEYKKDIKVIAYNIWALILPYYTANDGDIEMNCMNPANIKYLHIFNVGEIPQTVSGTVNGLSFTNVEVPPHKRIILRNSLYF